MLSQGCWLGTSNPNTFPGICFQILKSFFCFRKLHGFQALLRFAYARFRCAGNTLKAFSENGTCGALLTSSCRDYRGGTLPGVGSRRGSPSARRRGRTAALCRISQPLTLAACSSTSGSLGHTACTVHTAEHKQQHQETILLPVTPPETLPLNGKAYFPSFSWFWRLNETAWLWAAAEI